MTTGDRILDLASRLNGIPTWTAEKHRLKKEIELLVVELNLIRFRGRAEYFGIGRLPHIGESAFYRVPLNHRGKLKQFRGCTAQVFCIGNLGQYDRDLVAVLEPATGPVASEVHR